MSAKLVIKYKTSDGTVTHTWAHADEDVTTANVRTLVNTTISNSSLFLKPPVSVDSAKLVVTTESEFSLT